ATGATLGVLAILLVLFLLLLCLPWHKCDRYCSCCRCWLFSSNENIHRQSDDAFRAARMPGEYLAHNRSSQALASPLSTPPPTYSSTCLQRPSTTSRTGEDTSRIVENSSHTTSRQLSVDR
ncbi:uncharacterized protein DC041_0006798, partial [Schistosoma bovis]